MALPILLNKARGRRVSTISNPRTGTTRKTTIKIRKDGAYNQKVKERNEERGATFTHITKKNRKGRTMDKTKQVEKAPKPNRLRTVDKEKEVVRPSGKKRSKTKFKVTRGGKTLRNEKVREKKREDEGSDTNRY